MRVLRDEGAEVVLVAASTRAPYRDKSGTETLDAAMGPTARMKDFDAVIVPGGYAPDRMRLRHALVDMITDAVAQDKPVGAICHGPQVLITANVLRGRTLTCWPSIAVDVKNAGGLYVDRPAVRDGNLVTARKSDDLPAFLETFIEAVAATPVVRR